MSFPRASRRLLTRSAIVLPALLLILGTSWLLVSPNEQVGRGGLAAVKGGSAAAEGYPERPLVGAWCAEPSARDRQGPVLGPSVHIVYAIPSDAPDRFAEVGPRIAADVAAIEAWWRRQDPGRALRFDRYPASCGAQIDLTLIRLAEDTRYYSRFAIQGDMIDADLAGVGLDLDRRINLIYYGGPAADADVCGEGGGLPDELGRIVVFLQSCTDRDRARIVTHEILHALGALPAGAPHACPGDDGHPCDGDSDVLAPKVDIRPLETLTLDVGRDDYYGHRGSWYDLRDSEFLRRLDEPATRLAVTISGEGGVSSPSLGLDCDSRCVTRWDGRLEVGLQARPAAGMRFVRWEGDCSGRSCSVQLTGANVGVIAIFAPPTYALTLSRAGRGRIVSGSTVCSARCTRDVRSYAALRLRAEPEPGWRFSHWRGACRGTKAGCVLEMSRRAATHAVFRRM